MKQLQIKCLVALLFIPALCPLLAQTEALRIDSNGNVGIGTAQPLRKLEINNALRITNDSKNKDDGVLGANTFSKGLNIVGIDDGTGTRKTDLWGDFKTVNGNIQTSKITAINVEVAEKITAKDYALTGANANGPVPKGGIIMWSGELTAIPAGWALCDGSNKTPDLRNRFIVGAGDKYKKGTTGGQAEVKLTAAQLPPHTHKLNVYWAEAGGSYWKSVLRLKDGNRAGDNTARPMNVNTEDGNGLSAAPHENMPPYYSLAYIMKL